MRKYKTGRNCKISKKSVYIDKDVVIKDNVTICDNVCLKGSTIVEDGVTIFSGTEIRNSVVHRGSVIRYSIIEDAEIGEDNVIGPFSRIRPGTKTESNVLVGNFVEIKNSFIGAGTKACHLAYVGDSDIGKNVNIGCGAIFVNYNGKIKQRSIVKDNAFIGSNCNIIAPVKIEKGAYICAGTTITKDVKEDDFVIGRVRQEHKDGLAKKFLKKE